MSVFESEQLASTLRHYSRLPVSFGEISGFCSGITSVLNKANKRASGESDLISDLKKNGQLLWDHLLSSPVKEKLKNTPKRNLILFLDEELINIPWELIYDNKEFLCLKFNLGRLVRTGKPSHPPQYRSYADTLKMLVLANPTNDLKGAYLEGLGIKNQFDRKAKEIKIDFKSTNIDKLYVKKNLRDYDIVHFAGHCEYDDDDQRNTGWVLSDGRFTTQDILALGQSLSLPSLIFSNSCHSARVSPEFMQEDYQENTYSLASAFLFSGVRHYIGTIFKIEDPVGSSFAREFYLQLIKGQSVGECLRQARLRLIEDYKLESLSWANYLLYGDPDFMLFGKKEKPLAPSHRPKINLSRKSMVKMLSAAAVISIVISLYLWLPTINPSTYLRFAKAKNLFLKGRNSETISILGGIIGREPSFLAGYPLLADVHQRLGDPDKALEYYFEYAMHSQKRQDKKNLASAYIGIGWIYQGLGEYAKALDFYNRAIALARLSKDSLNEAIGLRKLAVWYTDREDYNKALELLTKSSQINLERQRSQAHRYNLACDYFDMGLVFSNKDDFETALGFYRRSQALFERLKLKSELSDYYFNLGEIYSFQREYHMALNCYLRGLEIDRLHDNKPSLASDYNMIGELYVEIGNLNEAEKFFNQALLISGQIKAPLELAATYYNLGLLYKQKRQRRKAREYLRQAEEIYRIKDMPVYQKIKEELLNLDNLS